MSDHFLNDVNPVRIPVRPGTDAYAVRARLVHLDGEETWTDAMAVRHAPGHVMCRIRITPAAITLAANAAAQTIYVWLINADVQGARNPT